MRDNEVRTLTLRLYPNNAERFRALASRYGYNPALEFEGQYVKVTTTFQNKAERSRLMSAWAKESCEVFS